MTKSCARHESVHRIMKALKSFRCNNGFGTNGFVWNFTYVNGEYRELSDEELCEFLAEYEFSLIGQTCIEDLCPSEEGWENIVDQPTMDEWWNGRLSIQEWWTEPDEEDERSSGGQPRMFDIDKSYMDSVTKTLLPLANMVAGGRAFKVVQQPDFRGGHTCRIVPFEYELGAFEYTRWKGTPLQYARQRPNFDWRVEPQYGQASQGEVDALTFIRAQVNY